MLLRSVLRLQMIPALAATAVISLMLLGMFKLDGIEKRVLEHQQHPMQPVMQPFMQPPVQPVMQHYQPPCIASSEYGVARLGPSVKPKAWIRAEKEDMVHLQHVVAVLDRLGYAFIGGESNEWDLLWSHDYPFGESDSEYALANMRPNQKVNKWPGTGFVTSKVGLATTALKRVPRAFRMPAEKSQLEEYAKTHPNTKWIQKDNRHRGIRIRQLNELNLDGDNFVQEFVDPPYLIGGRKFDFGVYTIVTSMDPLRIYIINHEMLVRFCAEDYYPFDENNTKKYVVDDNYTPIWELSASKKYNADLDYTNKQSLTHILKSQGVNVQKMFHEVEETIREVYVAKQAEMITVTMQHYKSLRNFFELVRFDFMLDKDANLYLMEVNMSPNLSSGHFPRNKLMYEQVLFNLFSVAGVASTLDRDAKIVSHPDTQLMQVSDKDIMVNVELCEGRCIDGCTALECSLCSACVSSDLRNVLKTSFLEHQNKRTCKRVLPYVRDSDRVPENWGLLNENDKKLHMWYRAKCLYDRTWCNDELGQ